MTKQRQSVRLPQLFAITLLISVASVVIVEIVDVHWKYQSQLNAVRAVILPQVDNAGCYYVSPSGNIRVDRHACPNVQ